MFIGSILVKFDNSSVQQTIELGNTSFQWGSKYARGLVVLNKINKDRIAHLWWEIMVIANSPICVIPKNDIFWMTFPDQCKPEFFF